MSWGAVAGAAVVTVGGLVASNQKAQAAKGAANAQKSATKTALAEEQRQFDIQYQEYQRKQEMLEQQNQQITANLMPYVQAGQGALFEMMALSGVAVPQQATVPSVFSPPQSSIIDQQKVLPAPQAPTAPGKVGILSGGGGAANIIGKLAQTGGTAQQARPFGLLTGTIPQAVGEATQQAIARQPEITTPVSPYAGMTGQQAQAQAIEQIAQSPILQELTRQGEEAILQNAAATGGLRGGNVQGLLARYRPQMLQDEINRQYARLSGISDMGRQAISQTPTQVSVGSAPSLNTAPYLQNIGNINAQQLLTQAEAQGEALGAIGKGIGTAAGAYFNK